MLLFPGSIHPPIPVDNVIIPDICEYIHYQAIDVYALRGGHILLSTHNACADSRDRVKQWYCNNEYPSFNRGVKRRGKYLYYITMAGWISRIDIRSAISGKYPADGIDGEKIIGHMEDFDVGGVMSKQRGVVVAIHENGNIVLCKKNKGKGWDSVLQHKVNTEAGERCTVICMKWPIGIYGSFHKAARRGQVGTITLTDKVPIVNSITLSLTSPPHAIYPFKYPLCLLLTSQSLLLLNVNGLSLLSISTWTVGNIYTLHIDYTLSRIIMGGPSGIYSSTYSILY